MVDPCPYPRTTRRVQVAEEKEEMRIQKKLEEKAAHDQRRDEYFARRAEVRQHGLAPAEWRRAVGRFF